jgi:catalase
LPASAPATARQELPLPCLTEDLMADSNGKKPRDVLTRNFGAPVADSQLSAGNPGPLLIADSHLIEKNAHSNRERGRG